MYGLLAQLTVVVHVGFVVFVALGGFLAGRHPRVLWLHAPAVAWGLGIVTIGWPCPLTDLENHLRERAGRSAYDGGFIDRYLTGVLYPESYERLAQAVVAVLVIGGYAYALRVRAARRDDRQRADAPR